MIRVCIAGATRMGRLRAGASGCAGEATDLALVSAVSRCRRAGRALGRQVLNKPTLTTPIFASVAEALAVPCDVVVDLHPGRTARRPTS